MKQLSARELAFIALFVALNIVSAYIAIPLPFTESPIALQPLIVNLVGLLLLPRSAFMVYVVYLILGLCGLPVFTNGAAGPGKLFGPTGGYIIGFGVAAVAMAWLRGKEYSFKRYSLVAIFIGIPIVYIFGVVQLQGLTNLPWGKAFMIGVLPFIPLDIVKCLIAAYIAKPLTTIIKNRI